MSHIHLDTRASLVQARWRLQGGIGIQIGKYHIKIGTRGIDDDVTYDETLESENLLLEIVQDRLRTYHQIAFSLAKPDNFVPLSFLEMGTKCSQSVCRIVQYLSLAELKTLVQTLSAAPNKDEYTAINLISILGISDQLAQEIFEPTEQSPLNQMPAKTALNQLSKLTDTQLARISPIPLGTGFLVGGSHLMTNNHVVPNRETARSCVAQFNYVQDALGDVQTMIEYELDPEFLFVTNPALDYTLVQLKSGMSTRPAGFQFGWLQLSGNSTAVCPDVALDQPENQAALLKAIVQTYRRIFGSATQSRSAQPGNQKTLTTILIAAENREKLIPILTTPENREKLISILAEWGWWDQLQYILNHMTDKDEQELAGIAHVTYEDLKDQLWQARPEECKQILKKIFDAASPELLKQIFEQAGNAPANATANKTLYEQLLSSFSYAETIQMLYQVNSAQFLQELKGASSDDWMQMLRVLAEVDAEIFRQELGKVRVSSDERMQILAGAKNESLVQLMQAIANQSSQSFISDAIQRLIQNSNSAQEIAEIVQQLITVANASASSTSPKKLKEWTHSDRLFLIQHPKGRRKEFVPDGSKVLDYANKGLLRNFLRYKGTADYGSSGSPVFNEHWELVALHHAAIPVLSNDGQVSQKDQIEIDAYQGVRICRIVEDLQKQSGLNQKLRSFVQDFVITPEQITYPPLPIALDFDGSRGIILGDTVCLVTEDDYTGSIQLWSRNGSQVRAIPGIELSRLADQDCLFVVAGDQLVAPFKQVKTDGFNNSGFKKISGFQIRDFENNVVQTITDELFPEDQKLVFDDIFYRFDQSPDGKNIAFCMFNYSWGDRNHYKLKLWHLDENPTIIHLPPSPKRPKFIKFAPDSKSFAVLFADGSICFWQISTLISGDNGATTPAKQLDSLAAVADDTSDSVHQLAFSEEGQLLAIASKDNRIQIWKQDDTQNIWRLLAQSPAQPTPPADITLSPDGTLLAYPEGNKIILLRSPNRNWQELTSANTPSSIETESSAKRLKFSPDGQILAVVVGRSGYYDKLQLWNVADISHPSLVNSWESRSIKRIHYVSQNLYANFDSTLYPKEGNQPLTIEVWCNPINGTILSKEMKLGEGIKTAGFSIAIEAGRVRANFSIPGDSRSYTPVDFESPPGVVSSNQLTHIAITVDPTKKVCSMYINGSSVIDTSFGDNMNLNSVSSYLLGTSQRGDEVPFNGQIAELRIWNCVRKPDEIRDNLYRKLYDKPSGLIGYWCFDEEERESKKIYNLVSSDPVPSRYTLTEGQTWVRAGQCFGLQFPLGLRFQTQSDCLSVTIAPRSNTRATAPGITIEFWICHRFGNIELFQQDGGNQTHYSLMWVNNKLQLTVKVANVVSTDLVMTKDAPTDQMWHHVAFTWDQKSQEITLYFNGRSQLVSILTGNYKTLAVNGQLQLIALFAGNLSNLPNVQIGKVINPTANCDVVMADVRVWKVARSPNQIKANMNRRLTPRDGDWQDLVSHWRLNDGYPNPTARNWVDGQPALTVPGNTWFPMPETSTLSESSTPSERPAIDNGKIYGIPASSSEPPPVSALTSAPSASENASVTESHLSLTSTPSPLESLSTPSPPSPTPTPTPTPAPSPPAETVPVPPPLHDAPPPPPLSPPSGGVPIPPPLHGAPPSVPTPPSAPPSPVGFSDIQNHWAASHILNLARQNIIKGYPDRSFRPEQFMSRAEFAAVLVNTFPSPNTRTEPAFTDVPQQHWAKSAIWKAYRMELMSGSSLEKFEPEKTVSRIQVVIVLLLAVKKSKPLPSANSTAISMFNDVSQLQPAKKDMLAIAVQLGIIAKPKKISSFRSDEAAKRAEVIAMLSQALTLYRS